MFSRAKRFDDKPVGCGADASYNPKDEVKPAGGVIPKVDRFIDYKQSSNSVNSDTESIQSERSQVFRTPKALRRNVGNGSIKKLHTNNRNLKLEEFLEAKNVEIRNKDETIRDYELQMKEMTDKIHSLETSSECVQCINNATLYENRLSSLSQKCQQFQKKNEEDGDKLIQLTVEHNEINTEVEAFLDKFNISTDNTESPAYCKIKTLIEFVETMITELSEQQSQISEWQIQNEYAFETLVKKDEEIDKLNQMITKLNETNNELSILDEKRSLDILAMSDSNQTNKLLCDELNEKIDEKDNKIKELMESIAFLKGRLALSMEDYENVLHKHKLRIDSLRTEHDDEILSIMNKHTEFIAEKDSKCTESIIEMREKHYLSMKNLEEKFMNQISHLEEVASENIRISEIQFEERYIELQIYSDKMIANEKQNTLNELQKCRDVSDKEINKYKQQTNEFKEQIVTKDNKLTNLSRDIQEYKMMNDCKEEKLTSLQTKLDIVSNDFETEIKKLTTEIEMLRSDVVKANKEKNIFSVTLNSTKLTVEALVSRLRKSDDDVMLFKEQLKDAEKLNDMLREEIADLHIDFSNSKEEYDQILTSLVNSKTLLDKCHNNIMRERSQLLEVLEDVNTDRLKEINDFQVEKNRCIDLLKAQYSAEIEKMEAKAKIKHDMYFNLKKEYDEAFTKIADCQNLLLQAESQLETKDQELNELEQENNRISGTLAASEQEKCELQVLLSAFEKMAGDTDLKIHDYIESAHDKDDEIYSLEDRVKKLTEFLEATEFIVKEKDLALNKCESDISLLTSKNQTIASELDDLRSEHDALTDRFNDILYDNDKSKENAENLNLSLTQMQLDINEKNVTITNLNKMIERLNLHKVSCEEEFLRVQCDNLQKDLEEMTEKYTNILGHQNNKQKIKHVADLKNQNSTLREENQKLSFTVQNQLTMIENLRKEMSDSVVKSPLMQKKQYLFGAAAHGKENRARPLSPSPSRLGSPKSERSLTPLKDSNR